MTTATVIGAKGFVGTALVRHLRAEGISTVEVGRGDALPAALGHVYYCAGLTSDFRIRLHDTIEAHVTAINALLRERQLESLTYLSSTRVYQRSDSGSEDALITVDPRQPSDLYNLSKLTGEAICLADARPSIRVVRLSNVYGVDDQSSNFLTDVAREAISTGAVTIRSSARSAKDYISLSDSVEAIARMPQRAADRIVNVAGGATISNGEIATLLQTSFGTQVTFEPVGPDVRFPDIAIDRMRYQLGVNPVEPLEGLGDFLTAMAAKA